MSHLRKLKKIYDQLGNDSVRSKVLSSAELLGMRKDILRMDTNNYCNIRCIMCNRENTAAEKHYMSLGDFTSIIDKFASGIRHLYLSCACEPLATPYFTEYLKYAKSKGIPFVSFCTNALSLHQDVIETAVDYGIDEIIVSFNGFMKEDYNRIMAGSDYDKVCDNLKALNRYKANSKAKSKVAHKELRFQKPYLRLNTVLLKANLTKPEDVIAFVLENGIHTVQFRELMVFEDQNNPEAVKDELLSDSDGNYVDYMETARYIADILRSHKVEVIMPLSVQNYQSVTAEKDSAGIPGSPETVSVSKASKHTCSVPFFSYWIDWEGYVRVCGYDEKGIIGNALSEDIGRLKEQRKHFQKLALSGECSSELCTMNINTSVLQ